MRLKLILTVFLLCPPAVFAQEALPPEQVDPLTIKVSEVTHDAKLEKAVQTLSKAFKEKRRGRKKQADALFQQAISQLLKKLERGTRGISYQAHYFIAVAQEAVGDTKSAEESFKKSLELKAKNALTIFRLANLQEKMNKCEEAISLLREARWLEPTYEASSHYVTSKCYEKLGKNEKSIETLKAAVRKNPNLFPAHKKLTNMRLEALKTLTNHEAQKILQEKVMNSLRLLSGLNPDDIDIQKSLVRMLTLTSDPFIDAANLKLAENIAKKIAEKDNYKTPETSRLLFDVQLKQRHIEDAKNTIVQAMQHNPGSETLLEAAQQLEIEYSAAYERENSNSN